MIFIPGLIRIVEYIGHTPNTVHPLKGIMDKQVCHSKQFLHGLLLYSNQGEIETTNCGEFQIGSSLITIFFQGQQKLTTYSAV